MKNALFILAFLSFANCLSAQWTTNGSVVYLSTTSSNVGIGTTNPGGFKLDVEGSYLHCGNGFVADVVSPGSIAGWFRGSSTGNADVVFQANMGANPVGIAYWMTAKPHLLMLGGTGGAEPTLGAINITDNGSVGIGTGAPGSNKLSVEGTIGARAVKVLLTNPWPDYVFKKTYPLLSFSDLDAYIKKNNHLPDMPSAIEANDGIDLGSMNVKLLEKVEELTLYVLELKKENEQIQEDLAKLTVKKIHKTCAKPAN